MIAAPDQFDEAAHALHWQQAAAFVEAYGDEWPDQAMANLRSVAPGDRESMYRWIDLIDKMTAIVQTPRQ